MLGIGPFEVDASGQLWRDGRRQALRSAAVNILLALAEQPGAVVPKRPLCQRAWPGREVDENNLQVEVSALRKLLGAGAIATASGRGYQLTLPVQNRAATPAPLFGRQADLATLQALLADAGFVNLVGEAGIGKTRLAIALALTQMQGPQPAVRVALDDARTADAVLHATAQALKLAATTGPELVSALARWHGLLVLDGGDGAPHAVADLVAAIRLGCPTLRLLCAGREALRLPGEHRWRLGALATDAACALFLDRWAAASALPCMPVSAPPSAQPAPPAGLAELCAQLDGNPLAIVLAAAQASAPDPEQRLAWLAPVHDPAVPRHRSLLAAFDSSWAALTPAERQLLAALVDLPQPFQRVDFEASTGAQRQSDADAWAQVDALGGLVDKSLVEVGVGDPPAYRLSSTTRLCVQRLRGDQG